MCYLSLRRSRGENLMLLANIWRIIKILTLIWLTQIKLLVHCLPNQLKIGILLHENQFEQEFIFKWSIEQINQRHLLNRTKLQGLIKRVAPGDCWQAERQVCGLIEEGAIAIIGPSNGRANLHIGSICDALEVPHFNLLPNEVTFNSQQSSAISATNIIIGSSFPFQPSSPEMPSSIGVDLTVTRSILLQAYLDLISSLGWRSFVYVYENEDSLFNFQEHFNGKSLRSNELSVKVIRFDPTQPYRKLFWYLKSRGTRQLMLDVECSNLRLILKHAQQVSMMTEEHSYLLVCLDSQTIDLEDFKHSRSRIVWLNSLDLSGEAIASLSASSQTEPQSVGQRGRKMSMFGSTSFRLAADQLKLESALVHDALETLAQTLAGVDASQSMDLIAPGSCNQSKPWPYGSTIVNHLRTSVELLGMTGRVRFDAIGKRSHYRLYIVRLAEDGPKTIGNWSQFPSEMNEVAPGGGSGSGTESETETGTGTDEAEMELREFTSSNSNSNNKTEPIQIDRLELEYLRRGEPAADDQERDLLVVSSIKSEPYFMNKQTSKVERGNARYEGYAIDLIEELSRLVGFDYVFKEVEDGKYGKFDEPRKEWNGMIREVMIGKADLAIADLSITSSREDAVDFTLPFMSTGISILFKKPTTKELELFSFLSPFENHVWLYVSGAFIGVSLLLFLVSRISPYEWADPHPCRREEKILRNQFSVTNSFWFTIAALMQQGSDLAPRSLSTRLVAANWYFFTLIMISSYTANLAAFLTVEKVVYPIERAEELYHHPQHIQYGCVESGSTRDFFKHSKAQSTFKKMYQEMVFVGSNDNGKAEVEKGNYAFFMESTSIEYTIERHCNLTQIGGLLDSKGYGIALAKNSTRKRDYRTKLSEAILSLQESGVLEVLKNRWWKEKRGGGACDIDDGQGGEGVKELTLANVGGVFVVLGMGIIISFILCALELYSRSCRLASAAGTSKWQQVKRLVNFALSLSENY